MTTKVYLASCYSTDFDLDLVTHHIRHYKSLGILPENFLIVLHNRIYPDNLAIAYKMCVDEGVFPKSIWTDEYNGKGKNEQNTKLMYEHTKKLEWIVHAENDEFHEYDRPLLDLLDYLDNNDWGGVRGKLVDRVALGGELKKVQPSPSIFDQFPIKCESPKLTNISGKDKHSHKIMIYRSWLTPGNGVHGVIGKIQPKIYPTTMRVHHFRWNDTTYDKYFRRKYYVPKNISNPSIANNIINYIDKNKKLKLEDVEIVE